MKDCNDFKYSDLQVMNSDDNWRIIFVSSP